MELDADLVSRVRDAEGDGKLVARSACVLGFFGLCAMGPLMLALADPVKTKALKPLPALTWDGVRDGSYAAALETWAVAGSPIAYHLRGWYAEAAYELGWLDSRRVAIREGGWMFERVVMNLDPALVAARAADRRRHMRAVAARARGLGVAVLVVPSPGKCSIYPERAWPDGGMPTDRRAVYDALLADARAAELVAVDARIALLALRETGVEAYFARDHHWTARGAQAVARLVVAELAGRGLAVPEPRRLAAELVGVRPAPIRPGTLEQLGHRLDVNYDEWSPYPHVRRLQETVPRGDLRVTPRDGVTRSANPSDPDAWIAMAGTSFSEWLSMGLLFEGATEVNADGMQAGAGPLTQIYPVLERVERGEIRPRVIVWEFTERQAASADWRVAVPSKGAPR